MAKADSHRGKSRSTLARHAQRAVSTKYANVLTMTASYMCDMCNFVSSHHDSVAGVFLCKQQQQIKARKVTDALDKVNQSNEWKEISETTQFLRNVQRYTRGSIPVTTAGDDGGCQREPAWVAECANANIRQNLVLQMPVHVARKLEMKSPQDAHLLVWTKSVPPGKGVSLQTVGGYRIQDMIFKYAVSGQGHQPARCRAGSRRIKR
jgi:hypothetical protein